MITNGLFGHSSELKDRLKTIDEIGKFSEHCKGIGLRVVMTQGSFDLFHIGHKAYLAVARSLGDILVVGVDSDEKITRRKGKNRPVVPQEERLDVLAGLRSVDVLVLKNADDPKWTLLKAVRPDVLVVSESTKQFDEEEKSRLKEFCGEVVVLPPQAKTSTSARIRNFQLEIAEILGGALITALTEAVPKVVDRTIKEVALGGEK